MSFSADAHISSKATGIYTIRLRGDSGFIAIYPFFLRNVFAALQMRFEFFSILFLAERTLFVRVIQSFLPPPQNGRRIATKDFSISFLPVPAPSVSLILPQRKRAETGRASLNTKPRHLIPSVIVVRGHFC